MKQRMFGSRNIPKVAKYAIVIYKYTSYPEYRNLSHTAQMKARRTTKKMLQKLYDRLLKDKKYNVNSRFQADNFTDWMGHVIKNREDYKHFGVWMLEVNQCVHDVIHTWAQDYDPNDTESRECDFFQEIFEELTTIGESGKQ